MSHLLMGAFNNKKQYTMPQNAMKNEIYKCPECDGELILRQGNIRAHHFSHKQNSTCTYLEKPSELFQHLGAKHIIQYKLQNQSIQINRCCSMCKNNIIFKLPKCDGTYLAELEYRYIVDIMSGYNKKFVNDDLIGKCKPSIYVADCAIVDTTEYNYDIPYIIEIYTTSKPEKNKICEEWFKVNAIDILKSDIDSNEINCIRTDVCEECIDQTYKSLDNIKDSYAIWNEKDKDFYISYRLGQRVFRENAFNDWHLRLSHRSGREGTIKNDDIVRRFYDLFLNMDNKKIISHLGVLGIQFTLISKNDNHEDIILDQNTQAYLNTIDTIKLLIKTMQLKQNIKYVKTKTASISSHMVININRY